MTNSNKNLYYIGSTVLFISILCLIFYLFIISKKRVDPDYTIIETPIEAKYNNNRDKRDNYNYRKKQCKDICKNEICNDYNNQIYTYNSCNICKQNGLCWSDNKRVCVKCVKSEKDISCNQTYGCYRDNRYIKPLNPKFTGCQKCWSN